MTGRREDWQRHAACRYAERPDLWFPVGERGAALLQAEAAKAVCRTCPVVAACGEDALDREGSLKPAQRFGVWGGMTPRERAAEYQRRVRAARRVAVS